MAAPEPRILPLDSAEATLALVGGKGANLARLARAGFAVPGGFLVTTRAYQEFVAANGLQARILAALPAGPAPDPALLDEASAAIRALFAAGTMPEGLAAELLSAYAHLGRPAVAVRSSATAEDLPDLSFAGQQDTFLNVVGDEALLRAVVDCWASLWTARAIGYRARNGVPHSGLSLAVVVQRMVESQASGVLFTANPLTGLRTEMAIDATVGLGEALVGGRVEPDHYTVDMVTGRIAKSLGSKAVVVRSRAGGGTEAVAGQGGACQALPDAQVLALADLGRRVEALYGEPQDIEWAWAGDALYLLQSRPITSLYPLPAGMPPEPLTVMFSVGAVQGLLDPITPLGRDMIGELFVTASRLFGVRTTVQAQTVLHTAGERLWINITPLLRHPVGRRGLHGALGLVEPTVRQAVGTILDDPRLAPAGGGLSLRTARRLGRFALPVAGNLLLNLLAPDRRRRLIVNRCERVLGIARARCAALRGDRRARLGQLLAAMREVSDRDLPGALILLISGVAAGMAALNLLRVLVKGLPVGSAAAGQGGWSDRVLEVTRGLPHNPTTEMDLALWQVAFTLRSDPASLQALSEGSPAELANRYRAGALPAVAQQAFAQFLERYGARGLAELDAGRPRWAEDPTHIFAVVAGYLRIEDERQAPDAVFRRGAATAEAAIEELAAHAGKGRWGRLRARLVRLSASRVRALMGAREVPKFFLVRLMATFRWQLLALGREFVEAGELEQPGDLVYLSLAELGALAAGEPRDWRAIVAARRQSYQRELRRRQVPRLLLSDGRAFYEGVEAPAGSGGVLVGSPVSPGVVEGRVRVVLDPRHAELQPGEILVCPGTDPSWTPLFLTAAGLVMEVGGMMTHGAVVAREYGIPAVVGVDRATERLHTGQRVRLNGSDGRILLLEG